MRRRQSLQPMRGNNVGDALLILRGGAARATMLAGRPHVRLADDRKNIRRRSLSLNY